MNWTSLIGPAVVAAVISGLVSGIGIWISAGTARRIHTEKLIFDRDQAQRRAMGEIELAERKMMADAELTEKKPTLDHELDIRKRRAVLAEEVLADFYEARDIVNVVRSPGNFSNEGSTRPQAEGESKEDTLALNTYFAAIERLRGKTEFFSKLHARRYRFIAALGPKAALPYDDLLGIRNEIFIAVDMLFITYRDRKTDSLAIDRKAWEEVIWGGRRDDPVSERLNSIVAAIEGMCRSLIQGAAS